MGIGIKRAEVRREIRSVVFEMKPNNETAMIVMHAFAGFVLDRLGGLCTGTGHVRSGDIYSDQLPQSIMCHDEMLLPPHDRAYTQLHNANCARI